MVVFLVPPWQQTQQPGSTSSEKRCREHRPHIVQHLNNPVEPPNQPRQPRKQTDEDKRGARAAKPAAEARGGDVQALWLQVIR